MSDEEFDAELFGPVSSEIFDVTSPTLESRVIPQRGHRWTW
jgi:hypothetical protein